MKYILILIIIFGLRATAAEKMELLPESDNTANADEKLYPPDKMEVIPKKKEKVSGPDITRLAKLGQLEPFNDVVILQKRYLPRTKRLEFSPQIGYILNENFFNDTVLGVKLGYGFSESMGLEASYYKVQASQRAVTTDLGTQRGLATASLVTPSSFMGLGFKWSPIYGKMALFSKSIVPYDTFFLLGAGTLTSNSSASSTTFFVGSGQTYSLRQWLAFRWDFGLYNYSAKSSITGASENVTDLHVGMGVSFFFPSAGYR